MSVWLSSYFVKCFTYYSVVDCSVLNAWISTYNFILFAGTALLQLVDVQKEIQAQQLNIVGLCNT